MPVPSKQVPRPAANNGRPPTRVTNRPTGSILDRAVDVSSLEAGPIKLGVYGQNRVGKTTLAATFPKPMLFVSVEPDKTGGMDSVKGIPGVKVLQPKTLDEVKEVSDALLQSSNCGGYESVGFDSITSLQDMALRKLIGAEDDLTMIRFGAVNRQVYLDRAEETRNAIRPFLNLPVNVVVTGKEKDHNNQDKEAPKLISGVHDIAVQSFFSFDVGSGTAGWIGDCCGCIGRLYIAEQVVAVPVRLNGKDVIDKETGEPKVTYRATGKRVRRLLTQLHPNFAAGVRGKRGVPEYIEEPDYEKIRKVVNA